LPRRDACTRWVKNLRNLGNVRSRAGTCDFSLDLRAGCPRTPLGNLRDRGGGGTPPGEAGGRGDLGAVADPADRLFRFEEVPGDSQQVLLVTQVLRRPPAAEEDAPV